MWFPSKMLYSKVTRDEEAQDSFWQSNARSRRLQGLTLLATGFVAGVLGAFASKGFTTLLATPGEPQCNSLFSNTWTIVDIVKQWKVISGHFHTIEASHIHHQALLIAPGVLFSLGVEASSITLTCQIQGQL
jgi:hypothetical protein